MFEELFAGKKLSPARLTEYGFRPSGENYLYTCPIMEGEFLLEITLDPVGNVDTRLTETDTGEEYTLYKTTAAGNFLGQVRGAIEEVLKEIVEKCCTSSIFRQGQTLALLRHAALVYGDEPEFLWKSTPGNGILRRKDSEKWYAALLTIPKSRLGFDSEKITEIVNLHVTPERMEELRGRPHFYPGWHMNKKSWITIILDGSVADPELFALLEESYALAGKCTAKK